MGYIFDALNQAGDAEQPKNTAEESQSAMEQFSSADGQAMATALQREPQAGFGDAPEHPKPLGSVVNVTGKQLSKFDDRLVALTSPESIMAEEYRSIRTSMLARWEHKRNLVHTITSATPQEGKTITCVNLGISFAELRNRNTIVLEADLRLPTFSKLMALKQGPGLVAYLRGEATLDEAVQRLGDKGLHIIPSGCRANNEAVQLLSSQRMVDLLATLRERFDHIIIDTPPVIELADAGIIGAMSNDVLLVARMNRTPQTLVEQAIRTLKSYHAPMGGVIATDQSRSRHHYSYYRYGYAYGYGRGKRRAA